MSSPSILSKLKNTSFQAPTLARPRLIISAKGMEKSGKSHFALTAPGPIAYLSMDIGHEGVVDKFLAGWSGYSPKEIVVAEYEIPEIKDIKDESKMMDACDKAWVKLQSDYDTALKVCRTVILDTATEVWELLRLARFGRISQIKPHHYVQANREYREFIRGAYSSDCNLILLHKMKAEWADGSGENAKARKTGRYERAGFSDTGFLVQVNLWNYRLSRDERGLMPDGETSIPNDNGFRVLVEDCRQNETLAGEVLWAPENEFPALALKVMPGTNILDWL